jgi:hypothetical protein
MKARASVTLEAVFMMPLVLFIMVFIIYLSFYLHDFCRIRGITDGVLHKATMNLKHEADIETGRVNYSEINKGLVSRIFEGSDIKENEIEEYIIRLLSKGLISTSITEVNVSKKALNITIRVEGGFKFPLQRLSWIIPLDKSLVVEAEAAYHYPADSVRISEVILDTGSKIKGLDKLKESIGRILP